MKTSILLAWPNRKVIRRPQARPLLFLEREAMVHQAAIGQPSASTPRPPRHLRKDMLPQ